MNMSHETVRRTAALKSALLGGVALLSALPMAAWAQTSPASSEAVSEVVVTGSLIRGVAPVGTNVSSVSQADIQKSGIQSTNQLLSQIPAITNSFNIIAVTPASLGRSTFRPDLRSLGATGGASTLVLVDGHNLVGAGILQTTPDAGIIPAGALERVEVVADGGSSLYGADAIGGVINFITRSNFRGFEAAAHVGYANGYRASDINLTGGTTWSTGSALLSFSARQQSELSNADRDRPRQDLRSFGGTDFRVRTCSPGTIIANGTTYALPNRTPGTVNLCDTTVNGVLSPRERQASVFAAVTQHFGPDIDFDTKLIASERVTSVRNTQISDGSASIDNTNPFFQSIAGETRQTVALDYSSVLGPYVRATSKLDMWDLTPTLTWRMGHGWRTKALIDYGWSDTSVHQPIINSIAEGAALRGAGLTTSTALNPYNLAATNPTVIANIANFETYARARQTLTTARVNSDGPIATLPGGDVRVAVGLQWQRQTLDAINTNNPVNVFVGAVTASASRTDSSAFGEVSVPLVGANNGMPGIRSLLLDGSVRYDNYSVVGSTTNSKFGATWEVVDGLKFRGNWGTAFQAPSLADSTGAVDTRANIVASAALKPGDPVSALAAPTIQLAGGNRNLKPQTATTWSVGSDYRPSQIEGLELGLTYWHVDIKSAIGIAPGNSTIYTIPGYASYYIYRPTLAQAQALTQGQLVTGAASIASLYGIGNDPYLLTFSTRQNLGTLEVAGIDMHVAYRHPVSWGSVFGSFNGTRQLTRKSVAIAGAATVDQLAANFTPFTGSLTAGTDWGHLTAQATLNYTAGYNVTGVTNQTSVGAFSPVNLAFVYDAGHDLTLTLNIDNVLDAKPPFDNVNGGIPSAAGFLQSSTIGRYYNVGIRKRF